MATATGATYPTLASLRNLFPEGKYSAPIEILSQINGILEDAPVFEGNLDTGERTTIRTGLPQGTWRRFNQGTQPVGVDESQIEFRCGMLQARMIADKRLVEIAADPAAYRLDRLKATMEGLNQQLASSLIYDKESTTPERITGLAAYYSTINTSTAKSAENVIDCKGSGTNEFQSIYLVGWGKEATSLIYPKGTKAGMEHTDRGIQRIIDGTGIAGAAFEAYEDVIDWTVGLAVRNWATGARACNIDMGDLTPTAATGTDIGLIMRRMQDYVFRYINKYRYSFLMSPRMYRYLNEQRRKNVLDGGGLSFETVDGKRMAMFDGVPIRLVDAMETSETEVT
jgi:hypothetical protein